MITLRILTFYAGNSLFIIPALDEFLNHFGYSINPEIPIFFGIFIIIPFLEIRKMIFEVQL
jgi:hypothetical protein